MISESKKELRKTMKKRLAEFHKLSSESEKAQISASLFQKVTSLPEYKHSEILFAYIPTKEEADCVPLILDFLGSRKKVCVPKVDSESLKTGENKMDFYFLGEDFENQLETGSYGIREPKQNLEMAEPSKISANKRIFMLVPGVAFTKDGKRLGHGKGFYDIYIEKMKTVGLKPYLCGFCLPCQIVEALPTDTHDILMNAVVF